MFGKKKDGFGMELTIKVALFSSAEIKLWIKALEEQTSCTYYIYRSGKCAGERITFKQFLKCRRNTRCRTKQDLSSKPRSKNTNCPSCLNITLKAVNKKFRGRPENATDPEMPCVIVFRPIHNHSTAPKLTHVSEDTRQKLLGLYKSGHSPTTALQTIKIELRLSSFDYEKHIGLYFILFKLVDYLFAYCDDFDNCNKHFLSDIS